MADATVHVKLEDRSGGRVARVTVDNRAKLNCLSSELNVRLRQVFRSWAATLRCARWC